MGRCEGVVCDKDDIGAGKDDTCGANDDTATFNRSTDVDRWQPT